MIPIVAPWEIPLWLGAAVWLLEEVGVVTYYPSVVVAAAVLPSWMTVV